MPGAASPPSSPTVTSTVVMPAMEAMLITRDGLWGVAEWVRRECRPTVV